MATFTKVPLTMRSSERSTVITNVVAGDKIDIVDILGRPADGLIINTTADTDVIEFRMNNYITLETRPKERIDLPQDVRVWSAGAGYPIFSLTGATAHATDDNFEISSIEIVSLTGPASIEIVVH